jgi:hypothetical protein
MSFARSIFPQAPDSGSGFFVHPDAIVWYVDRHKTGYLGRNQPVLPGGNSSVYYHQAALKAG